MKKLIIIPTYNEAGNVKPFIESVLKSVPNTHILVVDDNSPDGTAGVVKGLQETNTQVHLLERPGKMGLMSAYQDGFRFACKNEYDIIFQMDSDFSHDPQYLPSMLEAIQTHDLVIGSRYVSGGETINWGLIRQFVSRGGSFYARTILNTKVRDLTGGFKCFRRTTLEAIDYENLICNGYSFQIETTYRALKKGLKVKEVPIIFQDRRVGQSKMSKKIFLEAILKVWQLRFMKI